MQSLLHPSLSRLKAPPPLLSRIIEVLGTVRTMDTLSRLIETREVREKRIDTYQVNGSTSITHLLYADDVLIFSKANQKSLRAIKSILAKFTIFSGLECIDTTKSSITFSKMCEDNSELQEIIGFKCKKLPISYLWFPITVKKSFNQCWKLVQPIEDLLVIWSGRCLSYGGRIQLLN